MLNEHKMKIKKWFIFSFTQYFANRHINRKIITVFLNFIISHSRFLNVYNSFTIFWSLQICVWVYWLISLKLKITFKIFYNMKTALLICELKNVNLKLIYKHTFLFNSFLISCFFTVCMHNKHLHDLTNDLI